jgi:uncharacterized membrane protein
MRFIWGIIWILVGVAVMRYNYHIVQIFGRVDWAERHLSGGLGGTYLMYKLVGLVIVLFAMLYMFNAMGFLIEPLGPVFGR